MQAYWAEENTLKTLNICSTRLTGSVEHLIAGLLIIPE